ncbi:hypothetical protein, conserved [Babesia bigemina]|uniref:Uncharacterized protein n=1 Tax=Babesia bigemina TaxID=5866 RepID=A0A061CZR5_BABBI|nr:hypothetical protein, conserved [Babesia bigemina]CDR94111.1 hypothetical protein, conserved [Babesia bigemina]|eukprot:XP_012766297.1 hypothetical protein, conserved [Babesia bigemina]
MAITNTPVSLEELKVAITQAYPGIEHRLKNTFIQHDVAAEGQLPYGVVEPLLRHFLVECGLDDYMGEVTHAEGILSHCRVSAFLVGTSLEDVSDSNVDRMINCEEMFILAVVWLKVISDMYQRENALNNAVCGSLWCGAGDMRQVEVAHAIGNEASFEQTTSIVDGEMPIIVEPRYVDHVNNAADEKELTQKNIEHYIQTLVNEAAANRQKGVKCFVYSSAITTNGGCVSAGAAIPQRRERVHSRRSATTGCC